MNTDTLTSNEQIAENLLSDIEAYGENIRQIIIDRLNDNPNTRIYWDAWFKGAKGKHLEDAERGMIYKLIRVTFEGTADDFENLKCAMDYTSNHLPVRIV